MRLDKLAVTAQRLSRTRWALLAKPMPAVIEPITFGKALLDSDENNLAAIVEAHRRRPVWLSPERVRRNRQRPSRLAPLLRPFLDRTLSRSSITR